MYIVRHPYESALRSTPAEACQEEVERAAKEEADFKVGGGARESLI